jgi:hypothetical protein
MTPEEILNDYFRDSENDADDAYEIAVEAIKQYAKDMCDRQRRLCYLSGMIDNLEIKNAPYPKELQ